MRDLWRKTAALFWEQPIFWLPLICADLIGFGLMRFQRLLTSQIIHSLLLKPSSVLSSAPSLPASEPGLIMKAALISAPFVWGTYFVNIYLYTTAFVLTATLVRMFHQHLQPNLTLALSSLRSRFRPIVVFSAKVLALYAFAAAILIVVTVRLHPTKVMSTVSFTWGTVVLVSIGIAFYVTPAAISLLRGGHPQAVPSQSVKWGRSFSILAVLASLAIAYFAQTMERSFVSSSLFIHQVPRFAIEMLASLSAAFPYVPLFIVLSLIATDDERAVERTNVVGPEF